MSQISIDKTVNMYFKNEAKPKGVSPQKEVSEAFQAHTDNYKNKKKGKTPGG